MRRIGMVLFILIGMMILFFPQVRAQHQIRYQKELTEKWKESLKIINDQKEEMEAKEEEESRTNLDSNMIGLLKMDGIDLEVPILEGTTKENLNFSITAVEPTGEPGKIGNLALAGHNNSDYGRNFNRLDEVEIDDSIWIETQEEQFCYVVTEKFYVKPEDIWILEQEQEKSILTLITCYPRTTTEKRLIVRGELHPLSK